MAINKKIYFYLPIIIFLAGMLPVLYHIGTLGLLEENEAFIGSVSRYMVDSENISTPILNGIKYFDKAPGVYWFTALGIRVFGANEFGARFFLSIASGFTAVCIYFIAKLFFGVQCALISCLLLCTSALFQLSFRVISPSAYSTAFEAFLCLIFFYYLNKPTKLLRQTFWFALSISFLMCGFSILLPIIAISIVAFFTGQKVPIKKLYIFIPGLLSFLVFGLGWYIIQVLINPGLLTYYLFKLPFNNIFINYNNVPFYFYLFLPLFAVFPWTAIWFQELKNKIKDFKEDPAVAYLVSWAFLPFIIHLFMTSRECSSFMSSLPPLLLLTAPSLQSIYFTKDNKTNESINNIQLRRKHNLIIAIAASVLGMFFSIYGYINFETARVLSQTQIFTGLFWLFSSLIMVAFMIKKLNKSVLVPAAMLIPSLILFTVPAIQGDEPYSKEGFLSSKYNLLKMIARMPSNEFICCDKPLYGWYFYTGKNFKLIIGNEFLNNQLFVTKAGKELIISDTESLNNNISLSSYLVIPSKMKDKYSKIITSKDFNSYKEILDMVVILGKSKETKTN